MKGATFFEENVDIEIWFVLCFQEIHPKISVLKSPLYLQVSKIWTCRSLKQAFGLENSTLAPPVGCAAARADSSAVPYKPLYFFPWVAGTLRFAVPILSDSSLLSCALSSEGGCLASPGCSLLPGRDCTEELRYFQVLLLGWSVAISGVASLQGELIFLCVL